jgi:tetratricopeptide (TPR) repeat protein
MKREQKNTTVKTFKIPIFLIIFLLIMTSNAIGQPKIVKANSRIIDSLEAILKTAESDSVKVLIWCEMAKAQRKFSFETAKETAEKALRNAKRLDSESLIGQAKIALGEVYFSYDKMNDALTYFSQANVIADSLQSSDLQEVTNLLLGDYFNRQENYKKAIGYYLISKNLSNELGNNLVLGETLNKIGTAYWQLKNNRKAFQFERDALAVFEANKAEKGITQSYINLGRTFLSQGDFEEAMTYFDLALNTAKTLKNNTIIAETYYNIGQAKYEQGQYDKALETFLNAADLAMISESPRLVAAIFSAVGLTYLRKNDGQKGLEYERKALGIFQSNNDLHGVAQSLNRLGSDYKTEVGTKQTVTNLREALKINENLGMTKRIGVNYMNLGYAYMQQSKFNEALVETKKGVNIAKNIADKPLLRDANLLLSQIYASKKQYKEAYFSHQNYKSLTDSLEEEEQSRQMDNFENRYENEMNQQNSGQTQKINRLQIVMIILGILVATAFLLLGYFYKSLKYARTEVAERDAMLEAKAVDYEELKDILKKVVGEE